MNKFYIKQETDFKKFLHLYKVYDKMPENMPSCFKHSTLICFDEVFVDKPIGGNTYSVTFNLHSMTDRSSMGEYLGGFDEISEDEYDVLYNKCAELKDAFERILNKQIE